jgi:hypothetical protein
VKRPAPPSDLQAAGVETWRLCWSLPQIVYPGDVLSVGRLSRLEDEASALRAELIESGSTLKRQVQNAKGDVIGQEPFAHPALGQLRRIGVEVAELCASLGLSPVARHNLGLEVAASKAMPLTDKDRIAALEQRLGEAERALGVLSVEQRNQSGGKVALAVVIERYAPKPTEEPKVAMSL